MTSSKAPPGPSPDPDGSTDAAELGEAMQDAHSAGSSPPGDPTADSLGVRVFRQTTSYATFRTLASLSTLVSYALLVRILDRREIGVFEIGMAYVGFGFLLGEGGLGAALVRKREDVRDHEYRVVLTTVLGVASVLAAGYFVAAPWIGRVNQFNDEETRVLRYLAPILVLRAFPVVPRARMQRELRFDQVGQVELASTLARNLTAVVAAFTIGGSWALVAAALAQASVAVLVSYALSPGFVGIAFRFATFRRLIGFGSKVQGTYLLHYVRENVPVGLLGPTLGPSAVAMYRFAYNYARIPSDALGGLARVHFRMYAMCDAHSARLASAIRTALRGSIVLGALIMGLLAAAAVWAVPLIYGEKWLPAIPIVWTLIPHVLADIALAQTMAMAQGQGRAGLALIFYVVWSGATWLGCGLSLYLGGDVLPWVGVGQSVSTVLTACLTLFWVNRQSSADVAGTLVRPLLAVSLGTLAAFAATHFAQGSSLVRALLGATAFLLVAGVASALLDREALLADLRQAAASFRSKKPARG
jgi:O-antigen/teichoic acid export membrane protein